MLAQLYWQQRFDLVDHPFHFLVRLGKKDDGLHQGYQQMASALAGQEGDGWVNAKDLANLLEQMATKIREQLNA